MPENRYRSCHPASPARTAAAGGVVAQSSICVPHAKRHAELAKHLAWSGYALCCHPERGLSFAREEQKSRGTPTPGNRSARVGIRYKHIFCHRDLSTPHEFRRSKVHASHMMTLEGIPEPPEQEARQHHRDRQRQHPCHQQIAHRRPL